MFAYGRGDGRSLMPLTLVHTLQAASIGRIASYLVGAFILPRLQPLPCRFSIAAP
jgi:hypothetical protein